MEPIQRTNLLKLVSLFLAFTAVGKAVLLLTDPFADLWGGGFPIQILWLSVFLEFGLVFATWHSRLGTNPLGCGGLRQICVWLISLSDVIGATDVPGFDALFSMVFDRRGIDDQHLDCGHRRYT